MGSHSHKGTHEDGVLNMDITHQTQSQSNRLTLCSSLLSLEQFQMWVRVINITQKYLWPFTQSHPPGQSIQQCPSWHRDAVQAQWGSWCRLPWNNSSFLPWLSCPVTYEDYRSVVAEIASELNLGLFNIFLFFFLIYLLLLFFWWTRVTNIL